MDPIIISTVISGTFATLGVLVSFLISRQETKIKIREIELKTQEIEIKARETDTIAQRLANDLETLKQNQYSEILKKRLEVYPKLWEILIKYNLEKNVATRQKDEKWTNGFIQELDICNAEIGVFFSQDVYGKFAEYRRALLAINNRILDGNPIDQDQFESVDGIYYGRSGNPGLASYIKDDLGSYGNVIIQARKDKNL